MSAQRDEPLVKFVTESTATTIEGDRFSPPLAELHVFRPEAGVVVVKVYGEHDLATKTTVQDLLMRLVEDNHALVIDLTEAAFIDSTFLNSLVQAHRRAQERGSRVTIRLSDSSPVYRVFEISALLNYLDVDSGGGGI
jgi:anti-anti-sigma factor